MSVRLRIITGNLAAMLVSNLFSIAAGFILFWFVAEPLLGRRLYENAGLIAARYFPLAGSAALLLAALGALWIFWITLDTVSWPLKRLKKALAEIRDGNLDYALAVSGHDEFSELAMGFEEMRVRLSNYLRLQQKAEAERSAMMASITHDLKTPITSIMGYAEGIMDGVAAGPEQIREYAGVIRKKGKSLQLLAEDLSLLTRLENAQLTLHKRSEDLGVFIAELAEEFAYGEPGLKLETRLPAGIRADIDREKLARVLLNLFQNSVKYKKPDQPGPELTLLLARQENDALLTVSDRGPGIDQSDLPHVFDQFYRADASRGKQSGSGLGLSIARQLVQLHGGKIWLKNNPDGGLTVSLSLPLTGEEPCRDKNPDC